MTDEATAVSAQARKLGLNAGLRVWLHDAPDGWALDDPPAVYPSGGLWVCWPRRAGGHRSNITDTIVRAHAVPLGIVDNKVAAVDADWSGLRFVWRRELRDSR